MSAFSKLQMSEVTLLPKVALELWFAEIGVSMIGIKRMLALMPGVPRAGDAPSSSDPQRAVLQARRLAWLVQGMARRLPGSPRCLAQSLVLRRLLARRGLTGQLVIGVRRGESALDAHAWVEFNGEALQPQVPVHRRIAEL